MTRPGVGPLPAPPSWLPAPRPTALKARAVSVPRHVVQGSRVVPPPVSRYPPGVVLQAYSPGARVQIAVVQRQVSSPNLSPKPTSFVVPAPSPGLVVQRPRPLCAPLPTWAAPATPPRAHAVDEKDSDLAPSVPSSGVPSVPNEESVDVRAGCDTLCEKLEATRKELTQMSKVSEVNFRLSTVSMVDPSKRDLHQIDVVEESETTGQTTGIPSPDSQTFKPSTKTVATDTDDLATFFTAATLTEAVDMVDAENFEGKGEEVKEVKEPSEVTQQEAEVEEVECQGTQEAHERETPQRKRCELPEGPGSARQYAREKNIPTEKAPESSEKSRSTSTVRVQITNRNSNPRLRPNSRSPGDSESKERRERSSSRPRMATQLHIPVSARLSSRRGNKVEQGLEKSFSARELSRPQPRQKGVLEIADVARLVASPEIGTLDDFLPNPAPEPEVLENAAPKRPEVKRRSIPGSPRRPGTVSRDTPETARTGSRMLWSQQLTQLTALSCVEQPRRSPSPQKMPRAITPSRETPSRGPSSSSLRRKVANNEVEIANSRSQKRLVTFKPRTRPAA